MKNLKSVLVIGALLTATLGCGIVDRVQREVTGSESGSTNSNKSLSDRAVDTAVGESKIGVPDCDEVINLINAEMNNPDDDFVTKAVKATVLNRIKDGIRDSVERNKTDTTELAKTCKEFKTQFDKYKTEQQQKANGAK
ncbi:MAG: hypothetical protein PSX80_02560 [bacterium]|nr:hypothetical protein [bacterium]